MTEEKLTHMAQALTSFVALAGEVLCEGHVAVKAGDISEYTVAAVAEVYCGVLNPCSSLSLKAHQFYSELLRREYVEAMKPPNSTVCGSERGVPVATFRTEAK